MGTRILSGNGAIVEGALVAGANFFSSYPITPTSEIMEIMVKKPVEFIQAEDEIAAINMCVGASLAGNKAMTATSGPGFSLMQETIGFAFKLEVPLLIVDSQRVGPSTGMPSSAAQGDILQARYGSHGDYVIMVFYPNSVEECYNYTIEAINASEESSSPVILLCDGLLSQMCETVELEKIKNTPKKRAFEPLGKGKRHFTGLVSKDGIPNTHCENNYREWYEKRKKKILNVAKDYNFYEYIRNEKADILLIAYGIASRAILPLKEKYSIFRPIRLFPILPELKKISEKYSKIIIIEMNDGQYKKELEGFLKRKVELISQMGGKISLKEIEDGLSRIC
ncbi:MAG: 2-oxoacid:acceptor oxidoreductase subunit alpha [Candidatus Woesearchaeota archaeon]